ncbi:MAG: cohesin domain-containing protein [Patescibacteria group bacterium]
MKFLSFLLLIVVGFFFFLGAKAQEPTTRLYLVPAETTMDVDEEQVVKVILETEESITSLKAYLTFDPSVLAVASIEAVKETFSYWWESEDGGGMVKLQASEPSPGVSGTTEIARFTMKGIREGASSLSFHDSSLALSKTDENLLDVEQLFLGSVTIERGQTPGISIPPSAIVVFSLFTLVFFGAFILFKARFAKKEGI